MWWSYTLIEVRKVGGVAHSLAWLTRLTCPCTSCTDSSRARRTPNARLSVITSTRYNSTTMAPIDDAIADLESQEPGEKLILAEFARKWGVSRATLSRRWRRVTGSKSNGYAQQQAISPQQELELVRYIKTLTEKGLPPTREIIRNFSLEVAHQ